MPNYVTNKVCIENGDIADILKIVSSEDREFDFNKLIPMPADLQGTTSGSYLSSLEQKKQDENVIKYGYGNWYDWSRGNWGTRWNANDISVDDCCITFDTAWSTPFPIFEELSRRLPEATIIVDFADEDIGSNCGVLAFKNGVGDFFDMSNRGEESISFANLIKYGDPD